MLKNKNRYLAPAVVGLLFVGATGCAGGETTSGGAATSGETGSGGTLAQVQEDGILRVAIANEPPYTKVNPDGTITGVDPDVLRAVTDGMGVETLEGVVTPFESMIPGLQAERWDVIAAGLNINSSRCEQVLFSEPVIVSTMSFAVATGNPKQLTSIQDLIDTPDATVAVMPGTFEESLLTNAGVPSDQIVAASDSRSGVEAVQAGRADSFITPTLALKQLVGDNAEVEVTDALPDAPVTGAGVAFRKGDTEFHEEYNEQLADFKESPEYAEILNKWGFDPEAVEGVTTEQLCQTPG